MPSITVRRCDDLPYGPGQSDYEYDAWRIRRDEEQMTKPAEKTEVVALPQAPTPMMMLQVAVEKGASVEQLERLMALQERYEANEAKKEFVAAITEFKKNAPSVLKDKKNNQYKSRYSSISEWVDKVTPALSACGLSARWEPDQTGAVIKMTCILTHARGHSESASMSGPPDKSGAKNPLQEIKSTMTYLEIATLQAITGLASKEAALDDDGSLGEGHMLDERTKIDFFSAIEALTNKKASESLWQTVAAACTKAGDVAAYDELKKAMSAKVKAINAAEKEGVI